MQTSVKSVLLVVRAGDPEARNLGGEIADYLRGRGCECVACEHDPARSCEQPPVPDITCDLVLVLGGDGTFIGTARRLFSLGVPFIGVNMGQVGFLAELGTDDWQTGLDELLAGDFEVCGRMLINYDVMRGTEKIASGVAVNDVVVSRGELARLIRLGMYFDDQYVISMRSDGVIVSTPTGSTAYGVSAGGPLVLPGVNAYCVTPICPFLNGFKPLVLPAERQLTVEVQGETMDVSLTEDGQGVIGLKAGDKVVISRHEKDLLLAHTSRYSFFGKLKTKGFLLER